MKTPDYPLLLFRLSTSAIHLGSGFFPEKLDLPPFLDVPLSQIQCNYV